MKTICQKNIPGSTRTGSQKMKAWVVLGMLFAVLSAGGQQNNVLLIIADDLGIDSLSAFNDDLSASLPPTPTIDSFQSAGITFTRFYAYSTCSPTRASILTGRYAFRTGVYTPTGNMLAENEFTLPDALIASGVISNRLAHIGKWHLGNDADAPNTIGGWPHFSGSLGGGLPNYRNWVKVVDGVTTSNYTTYATTDNVNDAADWIDAQGTNSWFLWVAFNAPHTPFHKPPVSLHDYDDLPVPVDSSDRRSYFEAMVQAMDTEIGRLLTHVDLSETTVIFMGDNGTTQQVVQPPFASNHAKGSIYEGGIRVPLLICGAAVSNGLENTVYDGPVHSVDLYATILDLFGVEMGSVVPEELVYDSQSFAGVLRGAVYARDPGDLMVHNETFSTGRSLVDGDYKLIEFDSGSTEFYNVALDLPETNNLLDGVLSPAEETIYEGMTNRLSTYYNEPRIYSWYMDGDDKFNVEIGWFADATFTLHRTGNLVSNVWTSVAGQEFEDNGEAILILRDPSPPSSNAFYYVTTP